MADLSNAKFGRLKLAAPVAFSYREADIAAQAATGAVRYDITFDPGKRRWYLDASWKIQPRAPLTLDEVRHGPVVAVDVNVGHLAVAVLTSAGQPITAPITLALAVAALPATTRDARIREAISTVLHLADQHHCGTVVIEDLNFEQARITGREHVGNRPGRGRKGRAFRRSIAGIPTGQFRDRMAQMAYNAGTTVVAVDPAYTSRWAGQHWLDTLRQQFNNPKISGHHAAAVVIGRRGLDQRAKRQGTRVTGPHQRMRTGELRNPLGGPHQPTAGLISSAPTRKPEHRGDPRPPPSGGSKTARPNRQTGNQSAQDRSGHSTDANTRLISVEERLEYPWVPTSTEVTMTPGPRRMRS